jgi:MoaA/NifB/PqqE/SkfB family radical SAM enzyme
MNSATASITARIDRVSTLAPDLRIPAPPAPGSVKIELTSRCDLGCFFCASRTRPRRKADMSRRLYARLCRELRELGVDQLGLFYIGESMLCDWLPEAIRFAKQECGFPYVFLTTNGRLASADRLRECMLAGLDSLKFSFNACAPEHFREITGSKAHEYRSIVDNIKDARWIRDYVEVSTGHRCALYASSLLYDGAQRACMQQAVAEILPHIDEHYWLPLYGRRQPRLAAGHARFASTTESKGVLRKSVPCWPLFTAAHITSDGRLSACCLDHHRRFTMGDLTQTSFMQAWHSPAFRALRDAHLSDRLAGTACEHCISYETADGADMPASGN